MTKNNIKVFQMRIYLIFAEGIHTIISSFKDVWIQTVLIPVLFPAVGTVMGSQKTVDDVKSTSLFHPDSISHHSGYRQKTELGGTWQFKFNSKDIGERKQCYRAGASFASKIKIPGVPQVQSYGSTKAEKLLWE